MSEREFIDAVMRRLETDPGFAADLAAEERARLMADDDELYDALSNDSVLTMAWDAGTMAASGCLSIRDWHGVYFITTSDHDPACPFGSVGEALKYDMISMPIPGLELQSGVVPLETLLMLGLTLLDESDGEVTINDRCYVRGADGQLTEAADG